MLANGHWDAGNRAAARQRAYWAITTGGELEFGYGRLPDEADGRYRVFGARNAFGTIQELCHLRAAGTIKR